MGFRYVPTTSIKVKQGMHVEDPYGEGFFGLNLTGQMTIHFTEQPVGEMVITSFETGVKKNVNLSTINNGGVLWDVAVDDPTWTGNGSINPNFSVSVRGKSRYFQVLSSQSGELQVQGTGYGELFFFIGVF